MRTHTAIVSILSISALSVSAAQVAIGGGRGATTVRAPMAAIAKGGMMMQTPRAVIGITTSTSTGSRDTLGLLVSTVTRNSPAEKAGIEEGNRIASINGVSLKLASADVGDGDMEGLMSRRLIRELDKVKPGDEVDLRVYGNGQTRPIKVKTVDPEDLYSFGTVTRKSIEERPTLGFSIGSTGSKRDTLGIFVMSVEDGGPAAKAGIEEGQRIAALNGVDLRVGHDDAGDEVVSRVRVNRFERELAKAKVGEPLELKVYANGQSKTVKVTPVAWSELDSHRHGMTIIRDGGGQTMIRAARPPMEMEFDGEMIGEKVRAALEKAQSAAGAGLKDMSRVFDEMSRGMGPGTVRWFDDRTPDPDQIVRLKSSKPEPTMIRKVSRTISM